MDVRESEIPGVSDALGRRRYANRRIEEDLARCPSSALSRTLSGQCGGRCPELRHPTAPGDAPKPGWTAQGSAKHRRPPFFAIEVEPSRDTELMEIEMQGRTEIRDAVNLASRNPF